MLTAAAALAFGIGGVLRIRPAVLHPEKRPLCVALLCLAFGAIFDVDPVYAWFDRIIGVTNFSDLMAHTLGLCGVYFLLVTLNGLPAAPRHLPGPSSRWLLRIMALAIAASAALFAWTPMPIETSNFTTVYGSEPTIAGYWAISIAFPTLCLVQLLRTSLVHWRSPAPELRIGLRLVAVGTVLGFIYAALKLVEVACQTLTNLDLAALARPIDLGLLGIGLFCIAAGLAVTSRPLADRGTIWARNLQAAYLSRRLRWLWRTICVRAGAAAVLTEQTSGSQFRLLRRVVEIRDAQAVLWSNLSATDVAAIRQTARTNPAPQTAIAVQAIGLALALRRLIENDGDGERGIDDAADEPQSPMHAVLSPTDEARELVAVGNLVKKALRRKATDLC